VKFNVKYLDGSEVEVVATASALRAFEARHDQALLFAVGTYKSYWAQEIAHDSLRQRDPDTEPDFDTWLNGVEIVLHERPVAKLAEMAELLGVSISADDVAEVTPTPTGRAAKARTPEGSSTPRSTRGKASKS
jgi:hypothetical protein